MKMLGKITYKTAEFVVACVLLVLVVILKIYNYLDGKRIEREFKRIQR
jgi:hypothetical protein